MEKKPTNVTDQDAPTGSDQKQKILSKDWFLAHMVPVLLVGGIIILGLAILLFELNGSNSSGREIAKSFMGVSFTAILGGLIKMIFDEHREMQEKKARVNDLKSELLHRLRDVFEKVDGARQLIEAHRSAKTYSEQIRNNIFPSISVLFDIKRSVADAKDTLEIEDVDKFRVGIHFMAAYLQALANEYKKKYPDISNMQFVHEKIKAEARDRFVTKALQGKENLTNDELSINSIPQPPTWVWDTIKELPYMGTFINDTYDSAYRKMFVDFYDECKRLLKGIVMKEEKEKKRLAWYDPKYIDTIHKIDDGSVNASLIDILIKELDKKIAESKEKNNVKTASVQQLVEIYESD